MSENPAYSENSTYEKSGDGGKVAAMIIPRLPAPTFDDGRGLYPERLAFDGPRGLRQLAKAAAHGEGISYNEFCRRALAARIGATPHKGSN